MSSTLVLMNRRICSNCQVTRSIKTGKRRRNGNLRNTAGSWRPNMDTAYREMKISVYIPSYNQKEYLFQAVESVLNQTLRPFEILIIDDCSTDGSQELIRNLANANPLVRYLFNETNEGIAGVRRKALENVRGDYFTYVDGDDLYLPNKLSIEAGLMNSGKYDVAFSNNMYVDPDDPNDVKWIWAYNKSEFPSPGNMHYETLARKFPRMSLFRMELINVDLLRSIGTYDQNLQIYEDY